MDVMALLLLFVLILAIFIAIVFYSSIKIRKKKESINNILANKIKMVDDLEDILESMSNAGRASYLYVISDEMGWTKEYIERAEKSKKYTILSYLSLVDINFNRINRRLNAILDRVDGLYGKYGLEKNYDKFNHIYYTSE